MLPMLWDPALQIQLLLWGPMEVSVFKMVSRLRLYFPPSLTFPPLTSLSIFLLPPLQSLSIFLLPPPPLSQSFSSPLLPSLPPSLSLLNSGAAPIVTGFALSPAFLILEWTLSPLVSNVTDPPNDDLPAESVFFVEEYVIRFEGGVIARVAEKSYLVRIPDGQIDPADGSDDTMLPFVVEVVYSDININTTLSTMSFTSVAVPNGAWQWDALCTVLGSLGLSRAFRCIIFDNGIVTGEKSK